MYNFTVGTAHTYFVGDGEWLVHNSNCLDWSIVSKRGETRTQHVMNHGQNNLQKPSHGVFYGDPVSVTNDAWSNRGNIQPITQNGVDIYQIPRANAGYAGGYQGQGQNLNYVTIITRQGTNKIITVFPSKSH